MACKPGWADSTHERGASNQIKLLRRENKILLSAIREISRIGHPYGGTGKVANNALLDIGAEI